MSEISCALFSTPLNKNLIAKIRREAENVFLIPNLASEKIELNHENAKIIKDLKSFDWLVFTDVLAVEYFIGELRNNNFDLYDLDELRICAFGETVSDKLRFDEIHADVISSENETENIFGLINDYLIGENLSALKFLIIKEKSEQIGLANKLEAAQSHVLEVPIYEILKVEDKEIVRIKALIAGGAIDQIIFSAPTDLIAFKRIFFEAGDEAFSDVEFIAADGVMFQMLSENNLNPKLISQI